MFSYPPALLLAFGRCSFSAFFSNELNNFFTKCLQFGLGCFILSLNEHVQKGDVMPKIIENPEQRMAEEARKQIRQSGYSAMTIRSVAKACGIGVGTVYNYFPSKEDLLAACMLEDWNRCVGAINQAASRSEEPEAVIYCLYRQLRGFIQSYEAVFQDAHAATAYSGYLGRYHGILRAQLAAPLRKYCDSDFSAEFIAEAILTWTMAGKDIDEQYALIKKLF